MRLLIFGVLLSLVIQSGCARAASRASGQVPENLFNPTIAFVSDDALSEALTSELMACGFKIVERRRLTSVLSEHSLSLSGLLEKDNAEKIGKIFNIDVLVLSKAVAASAFGDRIQSAWVKMVDIKTGQIIVSVHYSNGSGGLAGSLLDATMKEKIPSTAQSIARELTSKFGRRCLAEISM